VPDAAGPPPDEIAEAVDHIGVTRLVTAYADAVTRRDWDALAGLFLPDCVVDLDLVTRPAQELVGPDAMAEFVSGALDRFEFFEFVVLNHHVDLWPGGDRAAATGRVFMCELRQLHGATRRTDAFGRYDDRYANVDGRWMFAGRRYRSMARWPEGVVFPMIQDI
jgi:ketosteroid isomerase-like protein